MNILVSYDWLKEYVDLGKITPEKFAARVSLSGPGVERLYSQGKDFDQIVLGHVLEVKPHPQADKLRLAKVDVGDKHLSIVCGGSNLKADQWVAVARIGAKVKWHGEGELVELKPAEIRGEKSEGMICAANEIGLFDAFPHLEREILDLGEAAPGLKMKPGTNIAHVLGLHGDTVMDVEVTSNRPDAFSMVGMAREASVILECPFIWKPAQRIPSPARRQGARSGVARFSVHVQDKKLCPRFMAVRIDGIRVDVSPWWLKRRLLSAGIRPINTLVDITNFVMLELGQPMHVYDAEKLHEGVLNVRKAKKGEKMAALDGKEYVLNESMLVVADADRPVDIAGLMGGEETGVTLNTTSVVFEAATFDPVSVRRTARALNLYSDAQLRFEKGLSTQAPPDALARAVELCLELAGGSVASPVADVQAESYKPKKYSSSFKEINTLVGIDLPRKIVMDSLNRLGFKLHVIGSKLQATVPWWRDHDIESGRDLVEEVARVYGYARLPVVFPLGRSAESTAPHFALEEKIRTLAKGAGLTEVYSYSLVSEELMRKANYDVSKMLRVQNEFSSDFVYMRTTLLPSLLQVVADNQEQFREQALFEMANAYFPKKQDLPDEELELGVAYLGDDLAWRKAKGFVEGLYHELGIEDIQWKRLDNDFFWHPGRTVQAFVNGTLIGTMGEVHPAIARAFGIEGRVAMADLPLAEVFEWVQLAKRYTPVPVYPEAKRDLALMVPREIDVQALQQKMKETSGYLANVEWFDTYRGQGMPEDKKSVAFHLTFLSKERTLETEEVDEVLAKISDMLKKEFGATVRA